MSAWLAASTVLMSGAGAMTNWSAAFWGSCAIVAAGCICIGTMMAITSQRDSRTEKEKWMR